MQYQSMLIFDNTTETNMRPALLLLLACFLTLPARAADRPAPRTDNRMVVMVTAAEREQSLYEMREMLHGMFNIHNALSRSDMKGVATASRSMGPLLNRIPPNMRERLPTEFLEMGNALKETFETIARDAEQKQSIPLTQAQLAEVMAYCSGCHDSFQFKTMASKAKPKR